MWDVVSAHLGGGGVRRGLGEPAARHASRTDSPVPSSTARGSPGHSSSTLTVPSAPSQHPPTSAIGAPTGRVCPPPPTTTQNSTHVLVAHRGRLGRLARAAAALLRRLGGAAAAGPCWGRLAALGRPAGGPAGTARGVLPCRLEHLLLLAPQQVGRHGGAQPLRRRRPPLPLALRSQAGRQQAVTLNRTDVAAANGVRRNGIVSSTKQYTCLGADRNTIGCPRRHTQCI